MCFRRFVNSYMQRNSKSLSDTVKQEVLRCYDTAVNSNNPVFVIPENIPKPKIRIVLM